jgi:site-specific DNA-cytosine methylase
MSDWETVLAVDYDKWAVATYRANFPTVDVRQASVGDIIGDLREGMAAALKGGPPCQPFSDAGENEGESDARDCIPDFCAAVEKVKPRMFLMENVRGLLKERHLAYFGRVLARLEAAGYVVAHRVQDAVNYGVPQFRERVWVWGIRRDLYVDGIRHQWPRPTHAWPPPDPCMFGSELLPGVTVGQSLNLDGAIRQPRAPSQIRRDHPTDEPSPTVMGPHGGNRTLQLVMLQSHADPAVGIDRPSPTLRSGGAGHDGCCLRIVGGGTNPHYAGEARTERDITDEPSTTIAAGHTHNALPGVVEYRWSRYKHPPIVPTEPSQTVQSQWHKGEPNGCLLVSEKPVTIRRLTPQECARLQSCPDDFAWPEKITKTAMYRVIGNGWACGHGAAFSAAFAAADPDSRTVIDLFCGGGLGASGWHGRHWSYQPLTPEAAPC